MNTLKPSLFGTSLAVLVILVFLCAVPVCARDTLNPGEVLKRGDSLISENQQYTVVLERNGNLVLNAGNRPLWASNTQGGRAQRCIMQPDGNLVLLLRNDQPVWATNTGGKPGSFLVLQNDGNLVIYQPQPVWASNTERGPRDERRGRWEGFHDRRDREKWEDRGR